MSTQKKENENISFEQSLENLKKIITSLESGNLSLQDSLAFYKQGLEHSQNCQKLLDNAKHEIEILQNNELVKFQEKE